MRVTPGCEIPRKNPHVDALQHALFPREVGGKNSWQAVVTRLFTGRGSLPGWRAYHTERSTGSQRGFPDIVLVHAKTKTIVYAELKTEKGEVSDDQEAWLRDLADCDEVVYIWRPSDRDEIDALIQTTHERMVKQ